MQKKRELISTLTIAGIDPSGGAGVAADLKTFSSLGVYGCCVITTLTAQNTLRVKSIQAISPSFIAKQLQTLLNDIHFNAAKTGLLYSGKIIKIVASMVKTYGIKLVVDPVLASASGDVLTTKDAIASYNQHLLPVTSVVTPNVPEAQGLSGIKINSWADMEAAARRIYELGAQSVLIKGGHLKGNIVKDLLFYKDKFNVYKKPRVKVQSHGGGCVFSAAIAAYLAKGKDIPNAVKGAEQFIQEAFNNSLKVGKGRKPVNPILQPSFATRQEVVDDVVSALKMVTENSRFFPYIAKVGTQIAMAISHPSSTSHIVAIEKRIQRKGGRHITSGTVKFGASSHMARLILSCHHLDSEVRAAMNLHYDPALLQAFREAGFAVGSFDRRDEPGTVKDTEGASIGWGVKQVAKRLGMIPEVIYDLGEVDKEPMIRIIGRSASEVVRKASEALQSLGMSNHPIKDN